MIDLFSLNEKFGALFWLYCVAVMGLLLAKYLLVFEQSSLFVNSLFFFYSKEKKLMKKVKVVACIVQ